MTLDWISIGIGAFSGALFCALVFFIITRRSRKAATDTRDMRYRLMRGSYRILEEDWDAAIDDFRHVADLEPDQPEVVFVLGRLFRKIGQYGRAVRVHRTLAVRNDEKRRAVARRATFAMAEDYRAAGHAERAIEILEQLVDDAPDWLEPLERLMKLAVSSGRFDVAAERLPDLESRSRTRDDALASHILSERGLALIEAGDVNAAQKMLKDALKRAPKSGHVAYAFSALHAANGKPRPAFKALEEALEKAPHATEIVLARMRTLAGTFGLWERFDELLEKRLDSGAPMPHSTRIHQAMRLVDNGEDDKARERVRELLDAGEWTPVIEEAARTLQLDCGKRESIAWHCSACDAERPTLTWFCPSCARFETYFDARIDP